MVRVIGGGPAGTAAALAALAEGESVEIYEPGPVPRQKVCGDFLAPGTLAELLRLGVFQECAAARPVRIDRLIVHIGTRERQARLSETAWGLSRGRLEQIMLDRAAAQGAHIIAERRTPVERDVAAIGRRVEPGLGSAALCGFQAHFRGAGGNAAEIFFFHFGCVGLTPIEDGRITLCGLVHNRSMRDYDYDPDRFLASRLPLHARLQWLRRTSEWTTASLWGHEPPESGDWPKQGPYPAGDALALAEEFTGTGILNALITGRMAGAAAARGITVPEYSRRVEQKLGWKLLGGYAIATALDTGWARILAPVAPVGWLFKLAQTRATDEHG